MTAKFGELLSTFDQLPDAEKREAAAENLRRSIDIEFPAFDPATLVECAEGLFLRIDGEEAGVEP